MGGLCLRGRVMVAMSLSLSACVLALYPSGIAGARPSAPQLTVTEAQQVFGATWSKFDLAFAQGQLSTVAEYSTTDVLEAVTGSTGCGCTWTTPHSHTLFSVPVQHGYPLSFLAQIATPAPPHSVFSPFVTMVVLTKDHPRSPWLVAYLIRYAGDMKELTSSIVRAAPAATFSIAEVPSQLAQFFTAMVTTGVPPANDNWPQTGSTGEEVQSYLGVKSSIVQMGDQQQTVFSSVDNSVAFAYPKGDIMCGSYRSVSIVTTPSDAPTVQPSDRTTWGGFLAPGAYTSLTKLGMNLFCFKVNTVANPVTDETNPLSYLGSVYSITGTPAP
jgi:hypothetical protein